MRSFEDDRLLWGGYPERGRNRPTLLDLIGNRTLDLETAALLWLLVERKSSLMVAAAPQRAGKTTLLSALLDFIPPWYENVYTKGEVEDFSFLDTTAPDKTYITVPELSDHTSAYLWGHKVRRLFEALERGYSVAATIHADSAEEVVAILQASPVDVPRSLLHRIQLVVNLCMLYGKGNVIRRVGAITALTAAGASDQGPRMLPVARWDADSDAFELTASAEARCTLASSVGMPSSSMEARLAYLTETLQEWVRDAPTDTDQLQRMVIQHYQTRQPPPKT